VKNVHQKYAAVVVQRVRHPNGQGNAYGEVNDVSDDLNRHDQPPFA